MANLLKLQIELISKDLRTMSGTFAPAKTILDYSKVSHKLPKNS